MKKKKQIYKPDPIDVNFTLNGLLEGNSWDNIQEEYNSQKNEAPYREPTVNEQVANWIISKDQGQDGYQLGGLLDRGSMEQDALQRADDLAKNYKALPNTTDFGKLITDMAGQSPFNLNYGISALGTLSDALGDYNEINSDKYKNQINSVNNWNTSYGRERYSQLQNIPQFNGVSLNDVGVDSLGQSALDTLMSAGNGFITGGIAGAIVNSVITLGGKVAQYYKGKNERDNINQLAQYANQSTYDKIGYNNNLGNNIEAFTQMRYAKNGGNIHTKASGGYMNSSANDYPRQLTEFNTGGDHEENPNGGVKQGVNPQDGMPNLVEQGETKWNDYIFSKRIYADGGTLKANHINDTKYKGWSYSDISKDLFKEYEERPNDPISRRTWEDFAQKLQTAQEADKLKLKQKKVGGFLNSLDEEQMNALQEQMTFERVQQEELAAQQGQEYENQLYEQAAQQGFQGADEYYDNTMSSGGHIAAKGMNFTNPPKGRQPIYGTWNGFYDAIMLGKQLVTPWETQQKEETPVVKAKEGFPTVSYYYGDNPTAKPNDFVINEEIMFEPEPIWTYPLIEEPEQQPRVATAGRLSGGYGTPRQTTPSEVNPNIQYGPMTTNQRSYVKNTSFGIPEEEIVEPETDKLVADISKQRQATSSKGSPDNNVNTTKNNYLPLLRFAPVLGSGINYLKDRLGLQNRNDYSDAQLLQQQADQLYPVTAPYIAGYETFTPIDIAHINNAARSQAAAAMRGIANSSNGNRGYVSVNNAVNAYNMNNALGDLGINAARENMKERLAVSEFNRRINEINANNTMSVEEKNAAIQQAKAGLYSEVAKMRTQERYANDVARAANENAFWANIGALGMEESEFERLKANKALLYGYNGPFDLRSFYNYLMDSYDEYEEEQKKNKKNNKKENENG